MIHSPPEHGVEVRVRKRARSRQSTKTENAGTRNPWEKFASLDHWTANLPRTDEYNQRVSSTTTLTCHNKCGLALTCLSASASSCAVRLIGKNLTPSADRKRSANAGEQRPQACILK